MAKRTTHRSSAGKKLYAVRDASGKFKDIQTYERAHRQDLKKTEQRRAKGRRDEEALVERGDVQPWLSRLSVPAASRYQTNSRTTTLSMTTAIPAW